MRSFVAVALRARLRLDVRLDLKGWRERLYKDGKLTVRASGSDGQNSLPFYLNFNARIDDDSSILRLQKCFSVSAKFGGGQEDEKARIPIVKLDGKHGYWHLHQFDQEAGAYVHTLDPRLVRLTEFSPRTVQDALLFALRLFCKLETTHDTSGQLQLVEDKSEGEPVSLVV
jgi:hypothetical protein